MTVSLFLSGAREVTVPAKCRLEVLTLCLENGFSYSGFSWLEDGSVRFYCSLATARHLKRLARGRGMELSVRGVYGFPAFLCLLKRRLGLLLGTVAALLLTILSGLYVWDVEIVGNEGMTDGEIREILRECDFGVGSYLPGLSVSALENRVLLATDRLSWISINRDGTVARVQVIERGSEDTPLLPPASASPANLVATCDGQIEELRIFRGKTVVGIGQAVKKGELLVSGIYDSQTEGYRFTRAAGEVLARTERSFVAEIPFLQSVKLPKETKITEIRLNFFNFSLKIFKSTGNVTESCDIIEDTYSICNFGSRPIPIHITVTRARQYAHEERILDENEALEAAYDQLSEQLETLSDKVMLLKKETVLEWTERGVRLHCTVRCIENIAEQIDVEIKKQE